jgi:hypothetical protein
LFPREGYFLKMKPRDPGDRGRLGFIWFQQAQAPGDLAIGFASPLLVQNPLEEEAEVVWLYFQVFVHAAAEEFAVADAVSPSDAGVLDVLHAGKRPVPLSSQGRPRALEPIGQIRFVISPAVPGLSFDQS